MFFLFVSFWRDYGSCLWAKNIAIVISVKVFGEKLVVEEADWNIHNQNIDRKI